MTATGLPDGGAASAAEGHGSSQDLTDLPVVPSVLQGGGDLEARHRLRRALRILTAARRRDDGGSGNTDI
jgi:hypothetical protein